MTDPDPALVERALAAWDDVYTAEIKLGAPFATDNREAAMAAAVETVLAALRESGRLVIDPKHEWYLLTDDPEYGHSDIYDAMESADPDPGVIVEIDCANLVGKLFCVRLPGDDDHWSDTKEFSTLEEAEAAVSKWRESAPPATAEKEGE